MQPRCHARSARLHGVVGLTSPSKRHRRPTLGRSCPVRVPSDLEACRLLQVVELSPVALRLHGSKLATTKEGVDVTGRDGTHGGTDRERGAHMIEAVRDQWVIAAGVVLFLIAAAVWWRNR